MRPLLALLLALSSATAIAEPLWLPPLGEPAASVGAFAGAEASGAAVTFGDLALQYALAAGYVYRWSGAELEASAARELTSSGGYFVRAHGRVTAGWLTRGGVAGELALGAGVAGCLNTHERHVTGCVDVDLGASGFLAPVDGLQARVPATGALRLELGIGPARPWLSLGLIADLWPGRAVALRPVASAGLLWRL